MFFLSQKTKQNKTKQMKGKGLIPATLYIKPLEN